MNTTPRRNSFLGGAAVLSGGILMASLIGAVYKVPLVTLLGDAFADFSNAYYIYSLLLTIATAGLPVALSKLVAGADALGQGRQVQKIFRVSLCLFLPLGLVGTLVMFFGNGWLAGALHDPLAAESIRALAPSVLCVSAISCLRGYAQGHANMVPSAVSQIVEALGKLVIGLALAWAALKAGKSDHIVAAMSIWGVTIGEALALLYMLLYHAFHRYSLSGPQETQDSGEIFKQLLIIAVPITLTSSAVSIINLIDTSLVQGQLQNALHMSLAESRRLYSAYSGVMTLYNMPAKLFVTLPAVIIPYVSAAIVRKDHREASLLVRTSLHLTALLGVPMGVGMCVLAQPIVQLIFPRLEPELSGSLLAVLGIASILVCVVSVTNSILQAYGYQNLTLVVMIGAGLAKVLVNYLLVAVPAINIHGAPVGTLCCFGLAAGVNLFVLSRVMARPVNYLRIFFGPALATAAMAVVAWGVYHLLHLVVGNTVSVLAAILCAVVVYGFLVVYLKLLSRGELKLMPKGDKIADLLRLP